MNIKQISVFLENKPGTLLAMTNVLAQNNIDMRALNVAETKDFGIVRVIVDKVYDATTALKDAGYVHSVTPVVGVAIPDTPGGLNRVLQVLTDARVNVEYMYAFLGGKDVDHAYMIFRVQDHRAAAAALCAKGIRCVEKTGTTTDEVTSAVDALIAEKVDAVFTPTDNTIMTAELAIYEKFLNAKIPQYCGADSFALNGAFVGYGVDYTKLGTITADMVVQVLVDGKDPATLPVTTFDNGIAMINTESCAALGYDLAAVKQAFDGKCSSVLETTTQQNFD